VRVGVKDGELPPPGCILRAGPAFRDAPVVNISPLLPRANGLKSVVIYVVDRVSFDELVEVQVVLGPDRIGRQPAPHPGRIVAMPVVVETSDVVALFPAIPVLLASDLAEVVSGEERCPTIRKVLLVRDEIPGLIELDRRRSLMRAQLIVNPRLADVVDLARMIVLDPAVDERDALGAVADMVVQRSKMTVPSRRMRLRSESPK